MDTALLVLESAHAAPFLQGLLAHSLRSCVHVGPPQPAAQLHEKLPVPMLFTLLDSRHVPLFLHGLELHSLESTVHVPPSHPLVHLHR